MRVVLPFLSFFLLCVSLSAQVDFEKVFENVDEILEAKAIGTSFEDIDYSQKSFYSLKDKNGESAIYVFNFNEGGFLVISAEENMYPIIAYSFVNSCPEDNLPTGFQNYCRDVIFQTESVREKKILRDDRIATAWDLLQTNQESRDVRSDEGVEPMLQTQWNQGRYYNTSCPADPAGPDDHVLTGCVATALGQLMNYFRYPQQGEGYYSYADETYGLLEIDFSEQSYNWDAMGTKLTEYNPDVADLLYHIGVSVDMLYGPDGSGMYNHKGAYTLHTYFGYADTTQYFFRDSLDESFDWPGMLVEHLSQKIPLYYAGWSDTIYQMGHAFIVDGYQDSTFFHFNWGWGGSSDGYFNLNSLTPSGANFTLLHEAIAYATPDGVYPEYCNGNKTIENLEACIEDGSGPLNAYAPSQNCEWLIHPNDTVSYIEFELLYCDLAEGDELIVYDGADATANVLASFSGQNPYENFESSTDRVFVKFISDEIAEANGWMLSYHAVKPDFCTYLQFVTDSAGVISDGSNSYPYWNEAFCNWFIQPEGAENIRIEFTEMDIADGDYVRITDRAENQTIATLSGNQLPDVFDIMSDDVTVSFDTDDTGVAGGWSLNYAMNVVSVRDYLQFEGCSLYPNPTNEISLINFKMQVESFVDVSVLSADGKMQFKKRVEAHVGENQIRLDVSEFDNGLYFVQLQTSDKRQVLKLEVR